VQTLVLTDVATGWTECAPLLVREQKLLSEVLTELRRLLPFDLLGFDPTSAVSTSNYLILQQLLGIRVLCGAKGVIN
jgi:hypothetical protein